jgi:hypothetical protein
MSHAFHKYIAGQLLRDIQKRRVKTGKARGTRYHFRGHSNA